jgi:hypothetical protein
MMEDAELNFQSFQQRLAITYTLEGMQQRRTLWLALRTARL